MKNIKKTLAVFFAVIIALSFVTVVFAADNKEVESNNSVNEATEIIIGTTYTGNLDSATDVDYYQFSGDKSSQLCLSFTSEVGNEYKVFILDKKSALEKEKDPNKEPNSIQKLTISSNSTSDDSSVFAINQDAVYYIVVEHGTSFDDRNYKVCVKEKTDKYVELEPNNDPDVATIVTAKAGTSDSIKGYISEGDEDYFKVSFPDDGYFSVHFQKVENAGDFIVEIYDSVNVKSNQKLIGKLNLKSSDFSKKNDVYTSDINIATGNYFIRIYNTDNSTGNYSFYIGFVKSGDGEKEYNDAKDDANIIEIGKTYYGNISHQADIDLFKVKVTEENRDFTIKFFNGQDNAVKGTWNVEILDKNMGAIQNGTIIFNVEDNPNEEKSKTFSFSKCDPGTYYVKVLKGSTYTDTAYCIKLTENEKKLSFLEWFKNKDLSNFITQLKTLLENIEIFQAIFDAIASIVKTILAMASQG